ncbi:MAG TPA: PaaI family thioesterase [Verrucomicrobiae bacterium]
MKTLPHTRCCFVCGSQNPVGMNLRFTVDDNGVHTVFTPCKEHVGFSRTIHGGILATVLDEIMAWACIAQGGQLAYCAEMTTRFLNVVRPGDEVFATAKIVENKRGKLFLAESELKTKDGTVLVIGTGKYLAIKGDALEEMKADLVADSGDIRL